MSAIDLVKNAIEAAGQGFDKRAYLEIVKGRDTGKRIALKFNPTEFVVGKTNTFAEVPIPGLVAPPIQYVRGASEKLSFDAVVDTSDTLDDVRDKFVTPIRKLMNVDEDLHAPPVVRFVWDKFQFEGVLESLGVTYTLFTETGRPLRAKLGIALKQFTTIEEQVKPPRNSPDVEKTYVVRRGDTLSGIAEQSLRGGADWRAIARANGLTDPRFLPPGLVLTIPRVT
jgi:nucleoid-associated protein YgaU